MKIFLQLFLFSITFIALSWFSGTPLWKKAKAMHLFKIEIPYPPDKKAEEKLFLKAAAAKKFVLQKGFNAKTCFLIDMSLPSGQKRFFMFDLEKDSLLNSSLVAHGNCYEYWLEGRRYSNVVGSGCTSLGKYKIGAHYVGKWGNSYKLHGLDSTNSNAFERTVVLHGHSCIPDTEIAGEICQSNGCPTVSPAFLVQLKKIINASKKPVLFWIYE